MYRLKVTSTEKQFIREWVKKVAHQRCRLRLASRLYSKPRSKA